jgi:translation initiation factor 4E
MMFKMDSCMNIFQDGIQPMWEDTRNRKGGRWLINMDKRHRMRDLDNFWLETVSR